MKKIALRSAWNYDADKVSADTGLSCQDEDQTKQEFKEECDINTILKRFNITGQLPTDVRMPSFGDFSTVHDFQTAVNAIAEANEAFDEMPAEVRARFGNDPGAFVAFCSEPKNLDEARRLGLVPADELAAKELANAKTVTIAEIRAALAVPGAVSGVGVAPGAPAGAPGAPGAAPAAPGGGAVSGVT